MGKKIVQSVETQVVDKETGEILVTESSKVYKEKIKEDSFYMTFIDFIAPYYKLSAESSRKLLTWMCEHAEFNTGTVLLPANVRKEISNKLGVTNNTITNGLKTLKTLGLISGEKGKFVINPQIFWKGDLKARRELLDENEFKIKFSIAE